MYCSAHKDIQPNQIQWILGRLLIPGNILEFINTWMQHYKINKAWQLLCSVSQAGLWLTYKWSVYGLDWLFHSPHSRRFRTYEQRIQYKTRSLVCPNRFESSSGGSFWRIHFQDMSFWISKKSKILCDSGLVSRHWQNATGKGKISHWGVYATQHVFVSWEEKGAQAWRGRLVCQQNFIKIVCCCQDWPQLPNDVSRPMSAIHPESLLWSESVWLVLPSVPKISWKLL